MPESSVTAKPWSALTTEELYSFIKLRTDVFLVEQKVDEPELDNRDLEPTTVHYFRADDAGAAAHLRTLHDDAPQHRDARRAIGRVVVRSDRRGEGLAQLLLTRALEDLAGEAVVLHSQEYIAPLYAKLGFESFGEVYIEAGIPHISMYRPRESA
ncbi:MAG: GNAT family N-acetyltransferase [Rhodoglobus sp.]